MPSAWLIERSESPRCLRRCTSYARRRRTSSSITQAALALDRLELLGGAAAGAERPMHGRAEHVRLVRRQTRRGMPAEAAGEMTGHPVPAQQQPAQLVAPLAEPWIGGGNNLGLVGADEAQWIGEHFAPRVRIVALL